MRIALLYPPPWKIPEKGEAPDAFGDGPPAEYVDGDLDGDFFQTPYGLFAIGAQALRAGHQVKVFNLSGMTWRKVEDVVSRLDADVYGLSCWTANRRGVALVAAEIKRRRPHAHVVVGGPHATPFAREMLQHHGPIDTVAIGESEHTFLELLERLQRKESPAGIPGTAFRDGGRVLVGPERPAIEDLDSLSSAHDWFDTHIVMTSRGCAWRCTFCGAEASWGRGYRGQSVPYVLDALERAVERAPVKMIQIKDDTFTTNRKRVIALCRGIRERNIRFLWSCDTRVDVLGEELLREMRLAGCERLSLGVESGSQKILDAIDKKITPAEIVASTELAKKYGIKLRYYMMLGNRGETRETFDETLRFLERARPHQYIFACLSVYPGTRDYDRGGMARRRVLLRARLSGAQDHVRRVGGRHDLLPRVVQAKQGPPRRPARRRRASHRGARTIGRPPRRPRRPCGGTLPRRAIRRGFLALRASPGSRLPSSRAGAQLSRVHRSEAWRREQGSRSACRGYRARPAARRRRAQHGGLAEIGGWGVFSPGDRSCRVARLSVVRAARAAHAPGAAAGRLRRLGPSRSCARTPCRGRRRSQAPSGQRVRRTRACGE
jgi:radical SAM superfamily enzyme YgiQ (UPF0313 family)